MAVRKIQTKRRCICYTRKASKNEENLRTQAHDVESVRITRLDDGEKLRKREYSRELLSIYGEITPYMLSSEKRNTGVKRAIDRILAAIRNNHQLEFQYQDRQPDGTVKLRKDGRLYKVNPYALVFRNNFYYLVSNYNKLKLRRPLRPVNPNKIKASA